MPDRSDFPEYARRVLSSKPSEVELPQQLETSITPGYADGPNLMCVYTGTIIKTYDGGVHGFPAGAENYATLPGVWGRALLMAELPTGNRRWTNNPAGGSGLTLFHAGAAMAAPAAFLNTTTSPNGWAVDGAFAQLERVVVDSVAERDEERLSLCALLASFDEHSTIFRVVYHVTVFGRQL